MSDTEFNLLSVTQTNTCPTYMSQRIMYVLANLPARQASLKQKYSGQQTNQPIILTENTEYENGQGQKTSFRNGKDANDNNPPVLPNAPRFRVLVIDDFKNSWGNLPSTTNFLNDVTNTPYSSVSSNLNVREITVGTNKAVMLTFKAPKDARYVVMASRVNAPYPNLTGGYIADNPALSNRFCDNPFYIKKLDAQDTGTTNTSWQAIGTFTGNGTDSVYGFVDKFPTNSSTWFFTAHEYPGAITSFTPQYTVDPTGTNYVFDPEYNQLAVFNSGYVPVNLYDVAGSINMIRPIVDGKIGTAAASQDLSIFFDPRQIGGSIADAPKDLRLMVSSVISQEGPTVETGTYTQLFPLPTHFWQVNPSASDFVMTGPRMPVPLKAHVEVPSMVTLRLYAPDGALVRSFVGNVPYYNCDISVNWDGKGRGGSPYTNSVFTASWTATSLSPDPSTNTNTVTSTSQDFSKAQGTVRNGHTLFAVMMMQYHSWATWVGNVISAAALHANLYNPYAGLAPYTADQINTNRATPAMVPNNTQNGGQAYCYVMQPINCETVLPNILHAVTNNPYCDSLQVNSHGGPTFFGTPAPIKFHLILEGGAPWQNPGVSELISVPGSYPDGVVMVSEQQLASGLKNYCKPIALGGVQYNDRLRLLVAFWCGSMKITESIMETPFPNMPAFAISSGIYPSRIQEKFELKDLNAMIGFDDDILQTSLSAMLWDLNYFWVNGPDPLNRTAMQSLEEAFQRALDRQSGLLCNYAIHGKLVGCADLKFTTIVPPDMDEAAFFKAAYDN